MPTTLIVFSPLRWNAMQERPQQLLSRLASGWRVLFVEEHYEAGRNSFNSKIHDDNTAIAAVLELEFLRSLLPEAK